MTEDEVKPIFGISSVYVMPSISEPFDTNTLEAISAGTPTIALEIAGFSEVFSNFVQVYF